MMALDKKAGQAEVVAGCQQGAGGLVVGTAATTVRTVLAGQQIILERLGELANVVPESDPPSQRPPAELAREALGEAGGLAQVLHQVMADACGIQRVGPSHGSLPQQGEGQSAAMLSPGCDYHLRLSLL
jgi:hypothetical protein